MAPYTKLYTGFILILIFGSCKNPVTGDIDKKVPVSKVQWGTYMGNYQRTGQSPFNGPDSGYVVWKKEFGGPAAFAPAIDANGTVYIGFENGTLYAIGSNDSILWEFSEGFPITTPSIDAKGILYFGGLSGNFYALDKNGNRIWSINLNERIESYGSAIDVEGNIYVCSETKLHSISPEGSMRWSLPLGTPTFGAPALGHNGNIYILSDSIYAIDTKGKILWTLRHAGTGNQWATPAIGPDGTIYVYPKGDGLLAISEQGILKWSVNIGIGGDVSNTPTISNKNIIYLFAGWYFLSIENTGNVLFKRDFTGNFFDSPPVIDTHNNIYIGTDGRNSGKNFYCFDEAGNVKFSLSIKNKNGVLSTIAAPAAVSKSGSLYLGSYRYSFGLVKIK